MSRRLWKTVNAVVGLSVLAMFAVAIIAGQARANIEPEANLAAPVRIIIIPGLEDVRYVDALPVVLGKVLKLRTHAITASK